MIQNLQIFLPFRCYSSTLYRFAPFSLSLSPFDLLTSFYCCYYLLLQVIIITNSDEGWVHYSAERYVPKLLPVLDKYQIISARTRYERFYPQQPLCWKAAAFAHESNELYETAFASSSSSSSNCLDDTKSCDSMELTDVSSSASEDSTPSLPSSSSSMHHHYKKSSSKEQQQREIISFGDSMEERTAVRIVAGQLDATPKSVMFIPSPTPVQLIGQLEMLSTHMKYICIHHKSLDLEISNDQANRCANDYIRKHKVKVDYEFLSFSRCCEEAEDDDDVVMTTNTTTTGNGAVPQQKNDTNVMVASG